MRQTWRIAGVLLLTMVVGTLSSTPALASVCSHADGLAHPSNCRRNGGTHRQPANHLCCAAGRDVAIPVSSFSGSRVSSRQLYRFHELLCASDAAGYLFRFAVSPSPPIAVSLSNPLRI